MRLLRCRKILAELAPICVPTAGSSPEWSLLLQQNTRPTAAGRTNGTITYRFWVTKRSPSGDRLGQSIITGALVQTSISGASPAAGKRPADMPRRQGTSLTRARSSRQGSGDWETRPPNQAAAPSGRARDTGLSVDRGMDRRRRWLDRLACRFASRSSQPVQLFGSARRIASRRCRPVWRRCRGFGCLTSGPSLRCPARWQADQRTRPAARAPG